MKTPGKLHNSDGARLGGFAPISYSKLTNWSGDDHQAAFSAFSRTASQMLRQAYPSVGNLIDQDCLLNNARRAMALKQPSQSEARSFFEDNFTPFMAVSSNAFDGFLTGYFEPELPASREQSDEFPVPIYSPPPELREQTDTAHPFHLDRAAIQSGALDGRDLELVWLKDKTDAYFVHVQGSARLVLQDQQIMRVAFAAKTGHPYTSLGKELCARLKIPPGEMTADILAEWMRGHPDEIDMLMAMNRSYIFFQERQSLKVEDGPIGAAGVPLTAGRSLAVDSQIHPYGLPIWLSTPLPVLDDESPINRLMIAQDTGSAITGTQRGDLFVGSGDAAGLIAGRIRSPARMVLLVPNS